MGAYHRIGNTTNNEKAIIIPNRNELWEELKKGCLVYYEGS